jgi:hypothetical protein
MNTSTVIDDEVGAEVRTAESLIKDDRAVTSPHDQVEQRLLELLHTAPIRVSLLNCRHLPLKPMKLNW